MHDENKHYVMISRFEDERISEVRKLNVVAQKRSDRPRKLWDVVIKNDRKKLDMDSADPQNRSEWRGRLRGRLVKKAQPLVEENGLLNGYDDDDKDERK